VPHAVFTRWQVLGGLLWTTGLTVAGYLLGRTIPSIDRYLLPLVALVVLVSLTPIEVEAFRSRRRRPDTLTRADVASATRTGPSRSG
jgi:membrane-associated protein